MMPHLFWYLVIGVIISTASCGSDEQWFAKGTTAFKILTFLVVVLIWPVLAGGMLARGLDL